MDSFIYSVGGHSGEVHRIHANGGFGVRIQELMYVPPEEFASTDKSRKALVRWFPKPDIIYVVLTGRPP